MALSLTSAGASWHATYQGVLTGSQGMRPRRSCLTGAGDDSRERGNPFPGAVAVPDNRRLKMSAFVCPPEHFGLLAAFIARTGGLVIPEWRAHDAPTIAELLA